MGDLEQFEDILLSSARNGDIISLQEIFNAQKDNKVLLNINCKGKSKNNKGWTPLHLASYFGHKEVVDYLMKNGADTDIANDSGDTALHKAAFSKREDIVQLLLQSGASVSIVNGEGLKASDLSCDAQISKLILAAERTEQRCTEERFLTAARDGDAYEIKKILKEVYPPDINCVDSQGNTSLHCASYRNHVDIAVALLQNGCDPTIRNHAGQTPVELVQTQQMQQLLEVKPVKSFYRSVPRFEGPLLRRMRIVGWRMIWAVLERGVITFFNSRADASSGVHRRDYKYLDGAKVMTMVGGDGAMLIIHYNDGTCHRFAATPDPVHSASVNRQKWVSSITDHIKFSTHYVQHGLHIDDDDDDDIDEDEKALKPLGFIQDVLGTAVAHQQLLEQQVQEVMATLASLRMPQDPSSPVHDIMKKFTFLSGTARSMSSSLNQCLSLMKQQEEVRDLQLKEEKEKVRVLEESLQVLATEHHELEESIASHVSSTSSGPSLYNTPANSYISLPRPRRFYDAMSDDVFFETCSQGSDDEDPTIGSGIPSPTNSECSSNTLVSCMSSLPTDPQTPTNPKYLIALPNVPQNSFSSSPSETNGTFTVSTKLSPETSEERVGNTFTINSLDSDFIAKHGHYRSVSGAFSISTLDDINLLTSSSSASANSSSLSPQEPLLRTSDLSTHGDDSGDSESTVTSPSDTMLHTDTENGHSLNTTALNKISIESPPSGSFCIKRRRRSWGRIM